MVKRVLDRIILVKQQKGKYTVDANIFTLESNVTLMLLTKN